jgi:hypothetical protein
MELGGVVVQKIVARKFIVIRGAGCLENAANFKVATGRKIGFALLKI